MDTLVIATHNRGKLAEFQRMFRRDSLSIVSLEEFPYFDIKEDGKTFQENALIKAKTVADKTGLPALGDDSGLEVMALGGRPGIYSARFAGEDATDEANINKLLLEMKNVPMEKRQARFVCSLALVFPDGRFFVEHGFFEGFIAKAPKGKMGFGYDPIFFIPDYGKTAAEISPEEKNSISHRSKAVRKIREYVYKP